MSNPIEPVVITGREIYDQLVRVRDAIAGLATRLDRLADAITETRTDLVDHEARLRALERMRWPLPSLAVLISVAGLIFAVLTRQ